MCTAQWDVPDKCFFLCFSPQISRPHFCAPLHVLMSSDAQVPDPFRLVWPLASGPPPLNLLFRQIIHQVGVRGQSFSGLTVALCRFRYPP